MFLTVLMLSYNVSLLARFSLNMQMFDVKVRDDICLLYFRQLLLDVAIEQTVFSSIDFPACQNRRVSSVLITVNFLQIF